MLTIVFGQKVHHAQVTLTESNEVEPNCAGSIEPCKSHNYRHLSSLALMGTALALRNSAAGLEVR